LPCAVRDRYRTRVARLLTLLIMIALSFTNGAAFATAICTHQDARAHMAARASADPKVAAVALSEESAAKASKDAALAEAAALAMAAFLLPTEPLPPQPRAIEPASRPMTASPGLTSRSIRPLLEPPLG
jgi:hypothetical protein